MKVSINVAKSTGEIKEIPLKKPVSILGRGADCDLRIPIENCSRKHCEIRIEGDCVFVKDLNSANGTYINNEKVAEAEIEPGDALSIGPVTIRFRINGEPKKLPPLPPTTASDIATLPDEYNDQEDEYEEDVGETVPLEDNEVEDDEAPIALIDDEDPLAALASKNKSGDDKDPLAMLAGESKDTEEDEDPFAAIAGDNAGNEANDALNNLASSLKTDEEEEDEEE